MDRRWSYCSYFVECCFQDSFKTAHSIFVKFPSIFLSIHFLSIHVVQPCCSIVTATVWKKYGLTLSDGSDRLLWYIYIYIYIYIYGGGHGNPSMAVFILIFRSHPNRWAAVVSRLNYSILAVEPMGTYVQDLVRHCVESSEGLSACLYVHHAAFHGFRK